MSYIMYGTRVLMVVYYIVHTLSLTTYCVGANESVLTDTFIQYIGHLLTALAL